ncbi:J domain-containing protein [Henriciella aquimarina]|uniref:J domain-containing protein n=1 Tax=Henriciella aquimarina TaxID=545261 RepID=UPI0009FE6D54|nr:J domain-containing protein [Henriciella aquimarina]
MADSFSYRVKFTDIRVKPPRAETERKKARETRACHRDGCDLAGEHPSPKPRGLEGVYWFCQKHAGEYNRNYDYFAGMSEAELAEFNEMAKYGFNKTWKFGTGPMGKGKAAAAHDPRRWRGKEFFEENAEARKTRRKEQQSAGVTNRALQELDLEPGASATEIRVRYSEYIRKFHPDSNGGDRSTEHMLARVLRAGKTLKAAGMMKG